MVRLVFLRSVWDELSSHLQDAAPSEDGAFLLIDLGQGSAGSRLTVSEIILPPENAWESRCNHNLRPSGQWLSAAIGAAIDSGSGLAFVHSHPDSHHPPELSWIDKATSKDWARTLVPTLQAPFASLVWTPSDISGWLFVEADHEPIDVDTIETLGRRTRVLLHGAIPDRESDVELDDRQRRALGELGNDRLRNLSVGLVGAGGTGSPLAEILARMGMTRLTIIDPDVLDTPSNLRRITGSTQRDLESAAAKADVVARHVNGLGLGTRAEPLSEDVRVKQVARRLLDLDLIISTTDTHSSRAHVNQVAFQYYVPVIDVGVKVGTATDGSISGMPVEVRLLLPDEPCLWCRGVLDAGRIREENLPPDERDRLRAEGYIQGVDEPQPSLAALNNVAASIGATLALQLATDHQVALPTFIFDPWELYLQPVETAVDPDCLCRHWRGRADAVPLPTL